MKNNILGLLFSLISLSVFADFQNNAFYGHWLLKSYADDLLVKKSTYELQERTGRMTEFVFGESLQDSVWVCYNNSEGAKYRVKFQGNNKAVFEAMNEKYELTMDNTGTPKVLHCKSRDSDYNEDFIFIEAQGTDFVAVNKWVNSNMLSGGYAPSIERGMRVRGEMSVSVWFNPDGTVTGIPGYDRYEIVTHFDDIADFDVLKVYNSKTKKYQWLGWEVTNNRLVLYSLTEGREYQFSKDEIFLQLEKRE